jgi:Carboxypeptidase regulatory-like domain
MRKFTSILIVAFALLCASAVQAQQTTGSISGKVTDQTGAVVPGATVTVKGEAGQEYTAVTHDDGDFTIPGVPAGTPTYTVTITATNFKKTVVPNVKVNVATPSTVNVVLEPGTVEQTVVITGGGEVLQTETATVGTTITGRQILEQPIQSRDALDLVTALPGTTTVGVVRTSSINGLPKSALTIQIDGVDVQDNFLKSSDGFFTFIRPRIDAIDEVTVSTATPGAESSGDGAVGIRFQTRRGTDSYRGSAFWQHRDEGLNAANFQNNYLKVPKSKLRLNQFGWSFGGPLPLLKFGQGSDWYDSGKGKAFFFFNYERFHLNESSVNRQRQVLTTDAQNGIFRYGAGGASSVNLFNIAAGAGLPNTIDPTVLAMLNLIRNATTTTGSFDPLGTGALWFRQPYNFANPGLTRRRFFVLRMDGNITKNHQIEGIFNDQPFRSSSDFLNSVDPAFPGLANAGTQNSDRRSLSIGLRSNFGASVVNQFRYAQLAGWLKGNSRFELLGGTEWFTNLMQGYAVSLGSGLTNPTIRNAYSSRSSPTQDFSDNVTWVKGNHTMTFGGQLKKIQTISDSVGLVAPTVNLGVATGDNAVLNRFCNAVTASCPVVTLPGANNTELANAQALYATLTGRVSGFNANAILGADGTYSVNGSRHFEIQENTNGLFAQDSWKVRPNLTLSYGLRWQPQTGAKMLTTNYAILSEPDMVYDVSGAGNLFSPGTLTGKVPTVRGNTAGEKAFKDDLNNFAPSVGVVWSPDFSSGFGKKLFGTNGASVFRGGFSRAFIREGTLIVENSVGQNPGGSLSLQRSTGLGNLTVGTLFRTPGNPNLSPPAFPATPTYPRALTTADAALGFSPDFHSGYVDSWSFGIQREIDRNTVVEVRYVGNRGKEMQSQYLINEINAIENGFGAEFALAQQNLIANINAGRGITFAHFAGTNTSPLPIMVSYLQAGNPNPNLSASYGSNFSSQTYLPFLSPANPNVIGFAGQLANNATTRANGTAAGRPVNFFHNCPTTLGFCFLFDNSEKSWFDAGVIEVRRRMSGGLRFEASYQFGKSFTNAFASANTTFFGLGAGDQSNASNNTLRNRGLDKTFSQIDIRHAFKFDATWDLPFGRGRQFMKSSNWLADAVFGGWTITPTVRWQSGSPILMENVQLVGMTAKELQDAIGVYYNVPITPAAGGTPAIANVTYLPQDIIENTLRAFTTTGNTTNGYAAGLAPTGRFIAPAGYGNCQQRTFGTCGFRKLVIFGPNFFKIDSSIGKRFKIGETRSVEFRMTMFDVLNHTNWRLGGWTGNVNNISTFTGQFGQMLNGWAYQDPNGSNDPGGRITDFMLRINF